MTAVGFDADRADFELAFNRAKRRALRLLPSPQAPGALDWAPARVEDDWVSLMETATDGRHELSVTVTSGEPPFGGSIRYAVIPKSVRRVVLRGCATTVAIARARAEVLWCVLTNRPCRTSLVDLACRGEPVPIEAKRSPVSSRGRFGHQRPLFFPGRMGTIGPWHAAVSAEPADH